MSKKKPGASNLMTLKLRHVYIHLQREFLTEFDTYDAF